MDAPPLGSAYFKPNKALLRSSKSSESIEMAIGTVPMTPSHLDKASVTVTVPATPQDAHHFPPGHYEPPFMFPPMYGIPPYLHPSAWDSPLRRKATSTGSSRMSLQNEPNSSSLVAPDIELTAHEFCEHAKLPVIHLTCESQ